MVPLPDCPPKITKVLPGLNSHQLGSIKLNRAFAPLTVTFLVARSITSTSEADRVKLKVSVNPSVELTIDGNVAGPVTVIIAGVGRLPLTTTIPPEAGTVAPKLKLNPKLKPNPVVAGPPYGTAILNRSLSYILGSSAYI